MQIHYRNVLVKFEFECGLMIFDSGTLELRKKYEILKFPFLHFSIISATVAHI
jgi:hypothetical protein